MTDMKSIWDIYDYQDYIDALNERTPYQFRIDNTGGNCMCLIAHASEQNTHVFQFLIGGFDGPLVEREHLEDHGMFGIELVEEGEFGPYGFYAETAKIVKTGITIDEVVDAVNAMPTSMPSITLSYLADVIVYVTGEQDYVQCSIPATRLGDYDGEADAIANVIGTAHFQQVIVLRDPTGTFERGCNTLSNFSSEEISELKDRHQYCEHKLVDDQFPQESNV